MVRGSSAGLRCGVDGAVRICRRILCPVQSNNLGASWDDLVSGSSTLTRSSNHPMFSQGGRGCSYCMTSGMSGVPSVKASEWGAG